MSQLPQRSSCLLFPVYSCCLGCPRAWTQKPQAWPLSGAKQGWCLFVNNHICDLVSPPGGSAGGPGTEDAGWEGAEI